MYGWLRKRFVDALKQNPRKPRKKETKPRKPRKLSIEHRNKISLANTGRILSSESKEKNRQSNLGKKHKPYERKPMADETKRKISETQKRKLSEKLPL
jgi:hypothetical protein